jgi:hypothetical protein
MKYYIYVSDSKVDMLYSQIPHGIREKIAAELKIDLKVLSVSLKEKATEQTRYSKAELVAAYIEKQEDLGTADHPGTYIKDILPMKWGQYSEKDGLVYFGGRLDDTIVGLCGSMHHVIGTNIGESSAHAYSLTPLIIAALLKDNSEADVLMRTEAYSSFSRTHSLGNSSDSRSVPSKPVLRAVALATTKMGGPVQRLEFLAKRLVEGWLEASDTIYGEQLAPTDRDTRLRVLLGSPIYVALMD